MPAVLQIEDMTDDFNPYYHGPGDTVEHMDHDYWIAQIEALVASLAHLAVPFTPTPEASATLPPTPEPSATHTTAPTITPEPSATTRPTSTTEPTSTTKPSASPEPTSTAPPSATQTAWSHVVHLPLAMTGRPTGP